MKITIEIPEYDGEGVDVIWDDTAKYHIDVQDNLVALYANDAAMISLARQMIYLAKNDLTKGSHIHFDSFFYKGKEGDFELVLCKT